MSDSRYTDSQETINLKHCTLPLLHCSNFVPDFTSLFSNILLKTSASVSTPIHFKHALHVHAKYFFREDQTIMQPLISNFQICILIEFFNALWRMYMVPATYFPNAPRMTSQVTCFLALYIILCTTIFSR